MRNTTDSRSASCLLLTVTLAMAGCGGCGEEAIAPAELDWPPSGVPAIAARAKAAAIDWRDDAQLIGVELKREKDQGFYTQSPEGRFSMRFTFYSPASREGMHLSPNAPPGAERYDYGAVGWEDRRPIPEAFMDLPDAVAEAHARGMRSRVPESAELRDWGRQTTVGSTALTGLAWLVRGSQHEDRVSYPIALVNRELTVRKLDACALVTAADASEMFGGAAITDEVTVPQGVAGVGVSVCRYKTDSALGPSIRVQVDESPVRDAHAVMKGEARSSVKVRLDGVGDEAYLFDSPAHFTEIKALVGDTLVELMVSGAAIAERRERAQAMVRMAVDRLISGEGSVEPPPADRALAGRWLAERDGQLMALDVSPSRAFALSVASAETGVVEATDGKWSLLSRARRPLLQGGYSEVGRSEMITDGAVEARWTRVTGSPDPTRVAAELLPEGLLNDAVGDGAGSWPELPVEPALVGLWEGEGTYKGARAELLWRIREHGPSTLVRVAVDRHYYVVEELTAAVRFEFPSSKFERERFGSAFTGAATAKNVGADSFEMGGSWNEPIVWWRPGAERPRTASAGGEAGSAGDKGAEIGRKVRSGVGKTVEGVGGFFKGLFGGGARDDD